ncbi:hypothetical protein CYMTET_24435 [Cymbomonas tetramitiformis]|uniref:CRAL-TRIO domain-containing protein n=1 Tax=Cymbomonas tetramitiformis TaxID=36881 RepID=A0AAE0FWK4_9CHLO|nr:hypothetical protein CYMTET_44775 [Cymbomonas tetramitiformis]KAK3266978.1 hypothetical protein CYMTET_24435 [Cymbomonas tetramitiformis]
MNWKQTLGEKLAEDYKKFGQADQSEEEELKSFHELVGYLKNGDCWPLPARMVIAGDIDLTLIRFLRARGGNASKAFTMIKATLAWRKEKNVETVIENTPSPNTIQGVVRRLTPNSLVGYDYEGYPVYVERTGMLQFGKFAEAGISHNMLLHAHLESIEYYINVLMMEASVKCGRTMDKLVTIMDMSGVTFVSLTAGVISMFKAIAKIDSDNYPEIMKSVYIVNAPWGFSTIWSLLRSFLDERTANKVHVIAASENAAEKLKQAMDIALLPSSVGGTGPETLLSGTDGFVCDWIKHQDAFIKAFGDEARKTSCFLEPNCFSLVLKEGEPVYRVNKREVPCGQSPERDVTLVETSGAESFRSNTEEEETMDLEVQQALDTIAVAMEKVEAIKRKRKVAKSEAERKVAQENLEMNLRTEKEDMKEDKVDSCGCWCFGSSNNSKASHQTKV